MAGPGPYVVRGRSGNGGRGCGEIRVVVANDPHTGRSIQRSFTMHGDAETAGFGLAGLCPTQFERAIVRWRASGASVAVVRDRGLVTATSAREADAGAILRFLRSAMRVPYPRDAKSNRPESFCGC
jgi:hypothetical protein